MNQTSILIAGCGDVGSALGLQLIAEGASVHGIRRNINQLPAGIKGIAADMSQPATLSSLPECDYLVWLASATEHTEEGYRQAYIENLKHLLAALPASPRHLFLASSSGVYHQTGGEWVDEDSPTEPDGFSGKALLEGEELARHCGIPCSIVRFTGIYGPGRNHLVNQVLAGIAAPDQPVHFSNRIHRDDCAGVLHHLMKLHLEGATLADCYLASDDLPVPLSEVMQWLAEQTGSEIKEHRIIRRGGSKRCSNRRLKATGYRFIHPDYRSGFNSLLDSIRR
ncbi:SDR family oxidoreductase [Nitrincola alkalilacustris]|uniref:SDR family oxidoreductase n=1 Tax=Nitrincola alkalilacustris TaxID=1571224 RepID=UPI00124CB667|nr:SDR family oxidoreductase [Nitrincola alkalilacustris]